MYTLLPFFTRKASVFQFAYRFKKHFYAL